MSLNILVRPRQNQLVIGGQPVYQFTGELRDASGNPTGQTTTMTAPATMIGGVPCYQIASDTWVPMTNPVPVTERCVLETKLRHFVLAPPPEPPEPVGDLGPNTLRFKFSDTSYTPLSRNDWKSGGTWTMVPAEENPRGENLWDYNQPSSSWDDEFNGKFIVSSNMVDIIGAGDMSGVTSMKNTAYVGGKVAGGTFGSGNANKTSYIRSIVLFDTSNVTKMDGMFFHCNMITTCPAFNTSSCTSFWSMFDSCTGLKWFSGDFDFSRATSIRAICANCNLRRLPSMASITSSLTECRYAFQGNADCGEYGTPRILEAYNYLSAVNPSQHGSCFLNTGSNTTDGKAELRQIPSGWK